MATNSNSTKPYSWVDDYLSKDTSVSDRQQHAVDNGLPDWIADYKIPEEKPVAPQLAQPQSNIADRVLTDPLVSVAKGVTGLGQGVVGFADLASGGYAGKALEDYAGYDAQRTNQFLEDVYTPEQKAANQEVQIAQGFLPTVGAALANPSTIAHGIVESAPLMLGGQAIASKLLSSAPKALGALGSGLERIAPKLAAVDEAGLSAGQKLAGSAIGEGAITAGSQAEQIRQQTNDRLLTPEQSALSAGSGLVTGAVTALSGGLGSRFGIDGDIDTAFLGKSAAQSPPKSLGDRALTGVKGGAMEGVEELVQSSNEQAASNVALNRPIDEGVGNAAATGMMLGFGQGAPTAALFNGFKSTAPTLNPIAEQAQAEADTAAQEHINQQAQGNTLGTAAAAANAKVAQDKADSINAVVSNAATPEQTSVADYTSAFSQGIQPSAVNISTAPTLQTGADNTQSSTNIDSQATVSPKQSQADKQRAIDEQFNMDVSDKVAEIDAKRDDNVANTKTINQAAKRGGFKSRPESVQQAESVLADIDKAIEAKTLSPVHADNLLAIAPIVGVETDGKSIQDVHNDVINAVSEWKKPVATINHNADEIVKNRSVKGKDTKTAIDDQYTNKDTYNPLSGKWEKPQTEIKPNENTTPTNTKPAETKAEQSLTPATIPASSAVDNRTDSAQQASKVQSISPSDATVSTQTAAKPSGKTPKGTKDAFVTAWVNTENRKAEKAAKAGKKTRTATEISKDTADFTSQAQDEYDNRIVTALNNGEILSAKAEVPDHGLTQEEFTANYPEEQKNIGIEIYNEAISEAKESGLIVRNTGNNDQRTAPANTAQPNPQGTGSTSSANGNAGTQEQKSEAVDVDGEAVSKDTETTKIRTIDGDTLTVLKRHLDAEDDGKPLITRDSRNKVVRLHRDNILSDQSAPTPYFAEEKIIGTTPNEQSPQGKAFATQAAAKAFQTKHFLQGTHDIKDIDDVPEIRVKNGQTGYVLVKNTTTKNQSTGDKTNDKSTNQATQETSAQKAVTPSQNEAGKASAELANRAYNDALRIVAGIIEQASSLFNENIANKEGAENKIAQKKLKKFLLDFVKKTNIYKSIPSEMQNGFFELIEYGGLSNPLEAMDSEVVQNLITDYSNGLYKFYDAEPIESKVVEENTKTSNTVFTEDMANAARARLKAKLGRLNSGVDPEMFADGIVLAGYHIEKGARTFAAYAKAMVADMGDDIKPYLKQFYYGVKSDPRAGEFSKDMDKLGDVEDVNIETLLSQPAIDNEAHKAATSPLNDTPQPTPAQKEAGNYKKGHITLHGLNIAIENPKGSDRSGVDGKGKKWSVKMVHHYGYIKGTVGNDNDHVDVFIGNNPVSEKVFVVNQINPDTGKFDEHKVLLGFDSMSEAKAGYLSNYSKGWKGGDDVVEISLDELKDNVSSGKLNKPIKTDSNLAKTDQNILIDNFSDSVYKSIVEKINVIKNDDSLLKIDQLEKIQTAVRGEIVSNSYSAFYALKKELGMDSLDNYNENQLKQKDLISRVVRYAINKSNDSEVISQSGNTDTQINKALGITDKADKTALSGALKATTQLMDEQSGKQAVYNAISSGNVNNVLGYIKANSSTLLHQLLVDKLIGQLPDGINISVDDTLKNKRGESGIMNYDYASKTVSVNLSEIAKLKENTTEKAFIHELIHAVTGEKINAIMGKDESTLTKDEKIARRQLNLIAKLITAHVEKNGITGGLKKVSGLATENLRELISYGLTEPAFQKMLSDIKIGKDKTAWTQFVHAVSKILGIELNKEQETALSALLMIGDSLLITQQTQESSITSEQISTINKAINNKFKSNAGIELRRVSDSKIDYVTLYSQQDGQLATVGSSFLMDNGDWDSSIYNDKFNKYKEQIDFAKSLLNGSSEKVNQSPSEKLADKYKPIIINGFNVTSFSEKLLNGDSFKTIVQARKALSDTQIQAGTLEAKKADEAIELAGVIAARQIVAKGMSKEKTFDALSALAEQMPSLSVRTSTSIAEQAYSTPLALAYVASVRAGIDSNTSVVEPTAGNGALLIAVNPDNAIVNELNQDRAKALESQGFTVTANNAVSYGFGNADSDVVIANPPFGTVKDDNGNTVTFSITPRYKTNEIDHAIAFNALKALKPDGAAVLIVGGVMTNMTDAAREDKYNGAAKRAFYGTLYNEYNVVDHFTVSGDLYAKQGAGYPVDVIVINGKGKSELLLPAASLPRVIQSTEELKNELQDNRVSLQEGRESTKQTDTAGTTGNDVASGTNAKQSGDSIANKNGRGDNGVQSGLGINTEAVRGNDATNDQRGNSAVSKPSGTNKLSDTRATAPQRIENSFQAEYTPSSSVNSIGTLVPINMQSAINAALAKLSDKYTSVDNFVASQLNYEVNDLGKYFSAEQVDAIALALDNIINGKGFIIGDQCVAGHTKIFNPVTRTNTTIKELAEQEKPINVLSMTKHGLVTAIASPPFKKGTARLFKVIFDDDREITVTENHRFLSQNGWTSIADGLTSGCFLVCAEFHQQKNSESSPLVHDEDGQHSTETTANYQVDYSAHSHQYDEQLRALINNDQELTPLQADVVEHTQPLSYLDDLVTLSINNHPHQSEPHLSKNSFSPLETRDLSLTLYQDTFSALSPLEQRLQVEQLSHQLKEQPHQSSELIQSHQTDCAAIDWIRPECEDLYCFLKDTSLRSNGLYEIEKPSHQHEDLLSTELLDSEQIQDFVGIKQSLDNPISNFATVDYTVLRSIKSIEFIGIDDFYDMWVAGYENYVAEGIVNHNTGVGKGRVNAAMIRYAMLNNITPIFVSEKPNLYSDMIRDLNDIGMNGVMPFATNSGSDGIIPLNKAALEWDIENSNAKENKLPTPKIPSDAIFAKVGDTQKAKEMAQMAYDGKLSGYDVVFTTYSQMQTIKGTQTDRMDFIEAVSKGALLILDESHNAGGTSVAPRKGSKNGGSGATVEDGTKGGRAGFTRQLVQNSQGVFYSSATYAKRPDVLDLYSKTDMGLIADPQQLKDSLQAGGVPLQQAVASMLAQAGQYIRREKSFDGIVYDTVFVDVDRQFAERASEIMRDIMQFDVLKASAIKSMDKELKSDARKMSSDRSTGSAGASSSNFTSVMHNMIGQMLLMLKVQPAIDEALAALKRGEKPVITLSNTMGSAIDEYAEDAGLNVGDAIGLHFGDLLARYLSKSRRVVEGDMYGKKESRYLTDKELGAVASKFYKDVMDKIDKYGFDKYPVSPIDAIHNALHEAGYKTGEITGRNSIIDYSESIPVYKKRPASQKNSAGKRKTISDFNNGMIDAVILNQSGATGLSLHSSPKVGTDTRKRHMIIAQPELNIDTHMQMLGRVNRTGQSNLPSYGQLTANIPAEKRPSAILAKKMAGLNAATTAGKDSAVKAKDVPDFMNDYGDEVAAAVMNDNRDIHALLGSPLKEKDTTGFDTDGAMRRVTGRIPVLSLADQEKVYTMLEDAYDEYIDMLNKTGQNQLEAKAMALDAKTTSTIQVVKPTSGSDSPFAEGVNAEIVDAKRLGKPYSVEQILELIKDKTGITDGASLREWRETQLKAVRQAYDARLAEINAMPTEDDQDIKQKRGNTDMLDAWSGKLITFINSFSPTKGVLMFSPTGGQYLGFVGNLERKGDAKNYFAMGNWKLTVYVADAAKNFTIPLSRISATGVTDGKWSIEPTSQDIKKAIEEGSSESREERTILTGNMLAAYAFDKSGQIVNYTNNQGETKQGILMPKKFDLAKALDDKPVVFQTARIAQSFVGSSTVDPAFSIRSADNQLRIIPQHGNYSIRISASKAQGGQYFLNPRLIKAVEGENFVKRGNEMVGTFNKESLGDVLDILYPIAGKLQPISKDKGKEFLGSTEIKPSKSTQSTNAHTLTSFTQAFTAQLDKQFGQGWTRLLMATGKVKVISSEEADRVIAGGELFSKEFKSIAAELSRDLREMGLIVNRLSSSKSDSEYLTVRSKDHKEDSDGDTVSGYRFKIRVSDHELPNKYKDLQSDLEVSNASGHSLSIRPDRAIRIIADKYSLELPARIKETDKRVAEQNKRLEEVYRLSALEYQAIRENAISEIKKLPDDVVLTTNKKNIQVFLNGELIKSIRKPSGFMSKSLEPKSWMPDYELSHKDYALKRLGIGDVKYSKNGKVQAFYNPANDTTYFVADNIDKNKDLLGLVAHELGVHALQLGKDDKNFKAILSEVDRMIAENSSKAIRTALARAKEANTKAEHVTEEVLSYLVEYHGKLTIVQKFLNWFKNKLRAIGKALPPVQRTEWFRKVTAITESDLVGMAISALKQAPTDLLFDSAGRNGDGVMVSKNSQLLAPNGKPSNLNAMQHAQVRTPEFKAWFGDWINNPENSSKIVDENGEPLVVYHGTSNENIRDDIKIQDGRVVLETAFNEFNEKGKAEAGIYFSPKEKVASNYGYPVEFFLNARNTVREENTIKEKPDNADSIYRMRGTGEKIADSYEIGVFNANQVKSAVSNTGAFSANNNDIRFSVAPRRLTDAWIDWWNNSMFAKNDKETGRKVPIKFYHATNAPDLTFFDKEKLGSNTTTHATSGLGFFFSPIKEDVQQYGSNLVEVYLSANKVYAVNSYDLPMFNSLEEAKKFSKSLQKKGYDGIWLKDAKYAIVFESNQAKLTSNEEPTQSPDIRYSMASSIADTAKSTFSQKARDNAIYLLQDKYIDLKRRMQDVVKNGGVITEDQDPRMAEELYHKRLAQRIDDFLKDELNPVLKGLHDAGLSMAYFQKFLHAKHAPSRNAVMAERNPNQHEIDAAISKYMQELEVLGVPITSDEKKEYARVEKELSRWERARPFKGTEEDRLALSGLSDNDAQAFIDSLPEDDKAKMQALADKIYAINQKTLDLQVEYGLETQQTIDDLNAAWKNYVPLHRDEAHPETSHPVGSGFSVKGSAFKNATGSNSEVTNILPHIAMAREQALTRGEKARVDTALINFLTAHPDPDFAVVGKVPTVDTLVNGFVETHVDPSYRNKDNYVMTRHNGKDIGIEFNPRNESAVRLALALKNMDGADLDMVENLIAKGTRWFASVNTQYNLIFGIMNLMRDAQGGLINLASTPLAGKQGSVIKAIAPALKAIYGAERGNGATGEMADLYREYSLAGGTTGFRDLFTDVKDREKAIKREFDKHSDSQARVALSATFKWLSDFNTAMENSVRLSAYKVARESGLSIDKSASIAKNITVNFNRKGAATTKIGAFYAFFNASVQGNTRMLETLRSPAGKKIIASGIALGAASTLLSIAAMGGDDWDKIPEHIRERNLIIPDFANKGKYIAIPLPLGFNVIPNIGRKAVEMVLGSNKVSKTQRFGELLTSFIDSFNPLGGKDIGQTITPTVADPIAALWRNKDWTGKSIYKEDFSSLNQTSGFTRRKDTATGVSKLAAEAINKLTGGTDYKQGAWSPTPDQLDYVFGQLGGGTYRELANAAQAAAAPFNDEELPMRKVPLLGKLYGETSGNAVERGAYYDNLRRLNEHENEINGLKKEPNGRIKLAKYLSENPDAKLVNKVKGFEKIVNNLSKRRKELVAKNADSSLIRAIDDRIAARMKVLNDSVLIVVR